MSQTACHSLNRGWCASRPPVTAPLTARGSRGLDRARPRRSKLFPGQEGMAGHVPCAYRGTQASRRSALAYPGYVGRSETIVEAAKTTRVWLKSFLPVLSCRRLRKGGDLLPMYPTFCLEVGKFSKLNLRWVPQALIAPMDAGHSFTKRIGSNLGSHSARRAKSDEMLSLGMAAGQLRLPLTNSYYGCSPAACSRTCAVQSYL